MSDLPNLAYPCPVSRSTQKRICGVHDSLALMQIRLPRAPHRDGIAQCTVSPRWRDDPTRAPMLLDDNDIRRWMHVENRRFRRTQAKGATIMGWFANSR